MNPRIKINSLFPTLFLIYILSFFSCQSSLYDPPKNPEQTLNTFDLDTAFTIELFATEPLIADPVEMIFDQKGRIYVVEMPDYPFKPEPGKGEGKIKQLFDDNQDGRIDRTVIFTDHISEATSVYPWRDGLLIAAAPNISWMRDTDGDGRADTSEIIFTGFFENNSEAQITNLKFMPDNWIYASNNGQGGEVKFLRDPSAKTISVAGGDFRFRLDRGKYELVSGPAQFGHDFNDRIHRFVTQNTLHIRQPVIPWKYLRRNPYLVLGNTTYNISDHDLEMFQLTPPPYWRAERTRRRQEIYDSQGQGRIEYAEDHFTGASGTTFYGGHTFPADYYGSFFIGDVAGNLIHRDIISPKENSPVYVASRASGENDREFLASTDSWFRPANFTVGPDGFLYVIDMYRQHIETPLSIPEDLKEDMDFLAGSDLGRIYRIRPKDQAVVTGFEDLELKSTLELVAYLDHPNQWHRLQAQRLILERYDQTIVPQLLNKFTVSEEAQSRLHALYCLEALDALNEPTIHLALSDASPTIREQAILLAEEYLTDLTVLFPLLQDRDSRVAFQACLTLGEMSGLEIEEHFLSSFERRKADPWFGKAILTSDSGSSFSFFQNLADNLSLFETADSLTLNFGENLAQVIGKRQDLKEMSQMQKFLLSDQILDSENYTSILKAFISGYEASENKVDLMPDFADKVNAVQKTSD